MLRDPLAPSLHYRDLGSQLVDALLDASSLTTALQIRMQGQGFRAQQTNPASGGRQLRETAGGMLLVPQLGSAGQHGSPKR